MAAMNLKTYRANTMADALAEVKKDLGKDAVILHTRAYKVGGWMGVGGKSVVEITASNQPPESRQRKAARPSAVATVAKPAPVVAQSIPAIDSFEPQTWSRPQNVLAGAPAAAPVEVRAMPVEVVRPAAAKPAPLATAVAIAPSDSSARVVIEEELQSIKRLVGQVLQCSRAAAVGTVRQPGAPASGVLNVGPMPEPLFANYMRLVDGGVSPELAEAIAGSARDELTASELADAPIVRETVLRLIASRIPVVGSVSRAGPMPDGRPLTVSLIGPTGVGKTTTVAKLAAAYKLRQGKKVGLITSDTYRIAAVEQLRTYANIIGLPLKVVLTPDEMSDACRSLSNCDIILIDTAGRSQHDATRLDELRAFIDGASPHETSLVLSMAAAEPVIYKTADRFASLRPDRAVFTKLDEAVHFGVVINAAARLRLPISYVTTGQEVPDQIELARPERLARLILDGELAP